MESEKILIIDDEQDFLDLLKTALKQHGYCVESANNGRDGINKSKEVKPDLVICDICMPEMDGYEVLRSIRAEIKKKVPVIMLSALEDYKNAETAYNDEADFYITKPVEFVTLLKNIRTILNLHKEPGKEEYHE